MLISRIINTNDLISRRGRVYAIEKVTRGSKVGDIKGGGAFLGDH